MIEMNRRGLMGAAWAALAMSSAPAFSQIDKARKGDGRHIVVIGGGIIGASIAYHLAASGTQVSILDASRPASGATHASFAWLNAGGKRPRPYFDLNLLGLLGWHRLQAELGAAALPVQWGGCVDWVSNSAEAASGSRGNRHGAIPSAWPDAMKSQPCCRGSCRAQSMRHRSARSRVR